MSKRDYYEVLGVQKTATDDELKKAFRRLAMKLHPDRNPDDPQAQDKFKEAKEAYEVRSNAEQRAVYDRHGHAAGDRVIADFGARLATAAGLRGVAGRLGGEEFAVLLPLADLASARLFAEAVRTIFAAGSIDGLPPAARVTSSFGVAARTGEEGLSPLLARADAALYQAKRNGRDSVRVSYERVDTTPFRAPVSSVA